MLSASTPRPPLRSPVAVPSVVPFVPCSGVGRKLVKTAPPTSLQFFSLPWANRHKAIMRKAIQILRILSPASCKSFVLDLIDLIGRKGVTQADDVPTVRNEIFCQLQSSETWTELRLTTTASGGGGNRTRKVPTDPPLRPNRKTVYTHFDVYASGNGWSRGRAIGSISRKRNACLPPIVVTKLIPAR